MKWNRKNIAIVALLAVAGGAFVVDRFVFGYGPKAVPPSESAAASVAAAPKAAKPAAIAESTHDVSLTERVARLAEPVAPTGSQPDLEALSPPAAWASLITPPEKPVEKVAIAAKTEESEPKFTITSVFTSPDRNKVSARINGRLVAVGEKVNGYTLMGVSQGTDKSYSAVLLGPRGSFSVPVSTTRNARTDVADSESDGHEANPK